jgi:hypothetical protein
MTLDVERATTILKDALLRKLGDEVDVIFRYGSYLKNATHKYSDLDISYTPVHASTWDSITVLVDDVMIDLYAIHWSKLEQMANFDDISATVLLKSEIVYQRSEVVGDRFRALPDRLRALQKPEARSAMLRKAQKKFQGIGYQYYLLRQQAAAGHTLSCMHHARVVLRDVLHCLAVCNQTCIDTRRLDQVLALPKLPAHFAETVDRVTTTTAPEALLAACETLLGTTRELLLAEQQEVQRSDAPFPDVFDVAYPELKGDLQHLMLACERGDRFNFNLTSLYHELMLHIAQAFTGVVYSDFNTLAEYEQDLVALGFPDLLSYVIAGDLEGLHQQCRAFDQRLQAFLIENGAALNAFATLGDLEAYLEDG